MKTNKLDERQEQELLKVEHRGCWIAYWGLLAIMIIQIAMDHGSRDNIAGEWILFMGLSIYLFGACFRRGIWDRKLKPDFKSNTRVSLVGSILAGMVMAALSYMQYHQILAAALTGVCVFVFVFLLCFLGLQLASHCFNKRVQKMDDELEHKEK